MRCLAAADKAANRIVAATGSWRMVFLVTAIMNFVVVGLALFVLRPLRSRSLVWQGLSLGRQRGVTP